jgi:hypothetical protein
VGTGIKDAEDVMSQLDEQMRQSSELTSVLSGPLHEDMDFDMEEEFESLLQEESVRVPASKQILDAPEGPGSEMAGRTRVEIVRPGLVSTQSVTADVVSAVRVAEINF